MRIRPVIYCVLGVSLLFACATRTDETKNQTKTSDNSTENARVENTTIETVQDPKAIVAARLKKNPDDVDALVAKAMIAASELNFDDAVGISMQILKKDPQYLPALNLMGTIFLNQDKIDLAKNAAQKALTVDARDPSANALMGRILLKQKDSQKSIAFFDAAIEAGNDDPYVLVDRAVAFSDTMTYTKAFEDLNAALKVLVDDAFVYLDRGRLLVRMKNYDGAIADFNRALSLNADLGLARAYRGEALYLKGDFVEAIKDLEFSKKEKSTFNSINEALATSYAMTKNPDKASPIYLGLYDPLAKNEEEVLLSVAWYLVSGDKNLQKKGSDLMSKQIALLNRDNILYQVARSYIDSKEEANLIGKVQALKNGNEKALAQVFTACALVRSGSKDAAYQLCKSAINILNPGTAPWNLATYIINEQS